MTLSITKLENVAQVVAKVAEINLRVAGDQASRLEVRPSVTSAGTNVVTEMLSGRRIGAVVLINTETQQGFAFEDQFLLKEESKGIKLKEL